MKQNKYIILLMLSFCATYLQAQSGWTREAKGFYVQATASYFSSNDYYTTEGRLADQGSTFNSSGLLLYGEYGISNRLTAIVDVPLVRLNSFSTTETVGGVGNIQLAVKYKLLKNFPLSLQVALDIPSNDGENFAQSKSPDDFGQINEINLPLSDGEFNVWTTLAASHGFANGKTYASAFTSINFRTESFSNQLQVGAEVGHLFFDKLYLIGKLKIQEKLSSEINNQSGSFLYGEGTTFTNIGITSMYKLNDHLNLVANYSDYAGFLVERKNIYDGGTISLGLSFEY
ncbi:hypothetical protein [Zobellia barbeyronii]|uniref:Transporter n=1 Tax=Zobellia barbeyronii TaxID=2748009 RepID=A0ABS5WG19_9FLAO|nr:hypothetical protein [Zobellia barbeyronii]MBT2162194.1 hypothetical protein [Zobellia barbeyronii]